MKIALIFLAQLTSFIYYSDCYCQSIKLSIQIKKKHTPLKGSILETQLLIWGNSVSYSKNENGKLQARVEIIQTIHQNDKIVAFEKYNLKSEERAIATDIIPDLVDIQNFNLKNGSYIVKIDVRDLNSQDTTLTEIIDSVEINYKSNHVFFSDIQLINSTVKSNSKTKFTKAGYEVIPKLNNLFTLNDMELQFYAEIYNLKSMYPEESQFLVKYNLKDDKNLLVSSTSKFRKINTGEAIALLEKIPLSNINPGKYNLNISIHNTSNQQITQKSISLKILDYPPKISASNIFPLDSINDDSVHLYIHSLQPIANSAEKEIISKVSRMDSGVNGKNFLANFWIKRESVSPYKSWISYKNAVARCDELFGTTVKEGFETDQGYVFLKYGMPNSVSKRDKEPNSYPYEIWHYYKIAKYTNKQFIFYNPRLNITDYELLHSDVPGEIKDTKWQLRIQGRTNPLDNIDQTKGTKTYGGQIEELHNLPK